MLNLQEIKSSLETYDKVANEQFTRMKEIEESIRQLERDTYGGRTYHEHINTLKEEIKVNDKISIRIDGYRVVGTYILSEAVTMELDANVYGDSDYAYLTIKYPKRTTHDLPEKYKEQYKELRTECFKHKITRPAQALMTQYNLNVW